MPGYMSIADCPCGYHSSSLSHGIRHTGVCLVVAYAKDRREVISLEKTEAKLQGLEFIQEMPVGAGYRCPVCGNQTLTFTDEGCWD